MNIRSMRRLLLPSLVPRDHWRNYPSGWSDQNNDPRHGRDGQRH